MLTKASRRRDFPSLEGMVYLNTAAEGIPPRAVLDALGQYGWDKLLGMDGRKLHEAQWQGVRRGAADLFGLTSEEIGICSCSSEAFNLVALAMRLRPGDEVIINDLDFPAGATPWLKADCPAKVRVWRSRGGALHIGDLVGLLGPRTRLVSASIVSFYNGYTLVLPELSEAVRAHSGAMVAVDVTQALGRIPLDLKGADVIVSSTHKWILGTHGGGLVGVPAARAEEWTVPAGGWFNLQNAFDADRFERVVTKPGAASFCVGMPNYPAVYAVNAALGYIGAVGVRAIDDFARPLVRECLDGLKRLPVDLLTPDEPGHVAGIIAFRHERADRIHRKLHDAGVHVMCHAGRLRVAIHGYNTPADIERFLRELREALDHA
ncbi:MAG TPA: aminotransferase class V-fold PLP-dependent enzyme [Verrucomicrobiae bacterium]|nr:aminotransferase class V-fold PLP-dependent enzyme [Verrucomicrobiae bacterium]